MQDIEKIYKEYFEAINKYLFCLTHNKDIAEELTQEIFYKAVKNINTYNGKCKMSVWLCQIAKNLWYDEYRKNKKIIFVEENEINEIKDLENVEDIVILRDERDKLYKEMQKLDEKTREVVYLRIEGNLSFKEIGDILGKNENWARVTFYRGKCKLKEGDKNG